MSTGGIFVNADQNMELIIEKMKETKANIEKVGYIYTNSDTPNSTSEYKDNLAYAFDRYRKYMDNDLIPSRIEAAMNVGMLLSEQTDLRNKNKTLTDYQNSQLKVVDRIISDFHNKGYTSLRSFQSLDYKVNEKQFQARFLKYTFMLVSFIFILIGVSMMNEGYRKIATILGSFMIIVYFILLYLNVRQNMMRYKYDWEKIYWRQPNSSANKTCDKKTNNIMWMVIVLGILSVVFGVVTVSIKK